MAFLIVITFLFTQLPWLGNYEGIFGLRVELPPAHLSTTHSGGFTLSLFIAKHQGEKLSYSFIFYCLRFDLTEIRTRV